MEQKKFRRYWLLTLLGVLAISAYPIYMGFSVIHDMSVHGFVPRARYPKYIIPYTPVAIAVLVALCLMPLILRKIKKHPLLTASGISLVVFFVTELLFENKIIVYGTKQTKLERWQMLMCYISPELYESREWRAVDILIGDYSPTFKIHFYMISVVLILTILSCLYGFGQMVLTGNRKKRKALILQSVCTVLFLGLCIFACFTAFFRDGELTVAPISAILMAMFFISLGATAGIFVATFLAKKNKTLSVLVPSVTASAVTLLMYIGEMCLLSGNLYILGKGFLFETIPYIILSIADILIVIASGALTFLVCKLINKK